MLRSLFSGISGLESFQTDLDVVGNNIANVDTVGFKASRVLFADLFYQMLKGASAPTPTQGGTNPSEVGLGTSVGDIYVDTSQGNLEQTGVQTDMAIQGSGYFLVQSPSGVSYTRNGHFSFDANGNLVNAQGDRVLGWMANNGTLPATDAAHLTPIQIPITTTTPATATTSAVLGGNLNATTTSGGTYSVGLSLIDSLGNTQPVTITFTNTGSNSWSWTATWTNPASPSSPPSTVGSGTIAFSPSGTVTSGGTGTISFSPPGANPLTVSVNFSGITQYASANTVAPVTVNGSPAGNLENLSVDPSGVITGIFTNGQKVVLAQVAVATFPNPAGLTAIGNGLYQASNNSGIANLGTAGSGTRGSIAPGALEMSNVDLAQEFTEMMIAERAFQANAQVITASDNVLTTLVQMIH